MRYRAANRAGRVEFVIGGHDALSEFEDVVGSPQADTILGDGTENKLDGGVGNDTLESGGGGGEAFGGPGTDDCSGFTVENSCGPESGAPPGVASVIPASFARRAKIAAVRGERCRIWNEATPHGVLPSLPPSFPWVIR